MPILEIEIVLRPEEILAEDLADRLANAFAEIFQSPSRGTWVKLRPIDSRNYSENDARRGEPVYPVFVKVLKAQVDDVVLVTEAGKLAEIVAMLCNRPQENVHVLYEPKALGRIAFGGKIR